MLLLLASCTYSGGELLYTLGFGQPGKVKAQFRLTSGPLLILIDDPARMLDWPPAEAYLFDHLSQELLRHKAAAKIVPLETVQHLRQSTPDFAHRGAREIGELAGAQQVLLLTVAAYRGQEQIGDVSEAGLFSVTVKVINVLEKDDPLRVRLWPESPRGKRVDAVMAGNEVVRAGTKDRIAQALAKRLARRAARLFYDYRPADFERDE